MVFGDTPVIFASDVIGKRFSKRFSFKRNPSCARDSLAALSRAAPFCFITGKASTNAGKTAGKHNKKIRALKKYLTPIAGMGNIAPSSGLLSGAVMSFDLFWAKYPRHDAKKDARKAWDRLNPSPALVEKIVAALAWQVLRESWQKDDGQFVPLAATWLRGERWEDEQKVVGPAISKGGLLLECPHEEQCVSRWACGIRQLQESMSDDDGVLPDVRRRT